MKAALFYGPRTLRVEEVPEPEIGSGEILIRVKACGICGSDLHLYRVGVFEGLGLPMGRGLVMGHELSGEVVAVGSGVAGIEPGNKVGALAMGGFAQMVRVPRAALGRNVFQLPGELSYEEAATLEPLASSLHAVRVAGPSPGDTVVILGAGIIGLGCLQVLKASNDCRVIVADLSQKRLDLARQLRADEVIKPDAHNTVERILELVGKEPPAFLDLGLRSGRVDIAMDCAGSALSPQQALEMVKRNEGKVVLVALYERDSVLDLNYVTRKGVRLLGSWGWTPEEFDEALNLVATRTLDRKSLISHQFPLEQIGDAFETQASPAESIKVLVRPNP